MMVQHLSKQLMATRSDLMSTQVQVQELAKKLSHPTTPALTPIATTTSTTTGLVSAVSLTSSLPNTLSNSLDLRPRARACEVDHCLDDHARMLLALVPLHFSQLFACFRSFLRIKPFATPFTIFRHLGTASSWIFRQIDGLHLPLHLHNIASHHHRTPSPWLPSLAFVQLCWVVLLLF